MGKSRKAQIEEFKKKKAAVTKMNPLPASNTAASKRQTLMPANTSTEVLIDHLRNPITHAYLYVSISKMRELERATYGMPDPYACVKTNFSLLANRVARETLLERGEIDEDTALSVTIPPLAMGLLKRIATSRISNLITGVDTICATSNRKRITPQHIMAYNRIARRIDFATRDLPMSTTPIDLTRANAIANLAEKELKADRSAKSKKTVRAPRPKLSPEEKEAAAAAKATLAAERKQKRDEAVARKKATAREAAAKKKADAEETAARKKAELEERKRVRAETTLKKKLEMEAKKKQLSEALNSDEPIGKKKKTKKTPIEEPVVEKVDASQGSQKKEDVAVEKESVEAPSRSSQKKTSVVAAPDSSVDDILGARKKPTLSPSPLKRNRVSDDAEEESPVKKAKVAEEKPTQTGITDILSQLLGPDDANAKFDYDF